jgi:hypothetical protein
MKMDSNIEIVAEEEKILAAQKEVDDINTKVFSSWSQILQNINSLTNIEKDINDIKKDQMMLMCLIGVND